MKRSFVLFAIAMLALVGGAADLTIDFGIVGTSSLTGAVLNDPDGATVEVECLGGEGESDPLFFESREAWSFGSDHGDRHPFYPGHALTDQRATHHHALLATHCSYQRRRPHKHTTPSIPKRSPRYDFLPGNDPILGQ